MYEAVQKNKPLVERIVTVTGKKLSRPSNLLVRIGTPIAALIEAAGGLPENTGKIIGGGPMMGRALLSPDVPVTKGSS
ncbi:SLBB domain-containing protein, partial [Enterococcus faecalis]|nr:SLBB domain-containing protein [Enterococcus faecalis]